MSLDSNNFLASANLTSSLLSTKFKQFFLTLCIGCLFLASDILGQTPTPCNLPSVPFVSAEAGPDPIINITVSVSAPTDGYTEVRYTYNPNNWGVFAPKTSYGEPVILNTNANTTLYFKARARNSCGYSEYSGVVQATTGDILPPTVSVAEVTHREIKLNLDFPDHVTNIGLYMSKNGGTFTFVNNYSRTATMPIKIGAEVYTDYSFYGIGYGAGASKQSSVVSVKTPDIDAPEMSASAGVFESPNLAQIFLTSNIPQGASGTTIYYSTNGVNFSFHSNVSEIPSMPFKTLRSPNATYYYYAIAHAGSRQKRSPTVAVPLYGGVNAGESCSVVGKPVNVTNGNMYIRQTDYVLKGVGETGITRTYNSVNNTAGLFGLGWTTVLDEKLLFKNTVTTGVVLPDGREIYFYQETANSLFVPLISGMREQLVKNADGTFSLTFKDGRVHQFATNGKLLFKKDRNDNQTTLNYDANGILVGVADSLGNSVSVTTVSGRITQISDSSGVIANYVYNTNGTLATVTYADNSKYQFTYVSANGSLRLATVKDALNNILETHQYDTWGRATTSEVQGGAEKYTIDYSQSTTTNPYTTVTDGLGRVTKYYFTTVRGRYLTSKTEGMCNCGGSSEITNSFYDAEGNVIKRVDALNRETNITYDANGNPLTINQKIGTTDLGTDSFTYNSFGQVLTRTDKTGGVWTNTYDANGNLKTTADSLGNVTTIEYPTTNNKGLPDSIKDARNNITKFKWFATSGLLQEIEDAYQKRTTFTYDARGRTKTVTDALNQVSTYNYFDDTQRKVEVIFPNADKITYKYDIRRLLESVTDERGKITSYEFDAAYRLKKITDPLGHAKELGYDLMSNPIWAKDALGNQTDYLYDDFNRLKEVQHPPATIGATRLKETFEYDKTGRLTKHYDTANRLTQIAYNDAARIKTVTNAEAEVTQTKYNARGQLTEVTDALNQVYTFGYDSAGRLLTQTRAGGTMSFEYDAVGNRTKRTDYAGRETSYEYDLLNRLKKINYLTSGNSVPTTVKEYNYDDLSRLVSAVNEAGTVSFSYDNLNRIISTTDVFGHLIEYGYDAASNRTQLKLDSNIHTNYVYDDANRLTTLTDETNQNFAFGYDNADRLISKSLPNSVSTSYEYDGMSRLKRLKDVKGATTLYDRQYAYNNASQINQIAEPSQTRNFGYDLTDRLTSVADAQNTIAESYDFDDVGNRTSSHLSSIYNYQPFNRMTATATASMSYDANGNLISKTESNETWSYVWDYENRMISVSNGIETVNYKYDALGRRVERTKGSENTKFTYDGQDVLVDDNNGVLTKYINGAGIDNKLKLTANGVAKYFVQDHLGSTNALTDINGNITESASYDSFGNSTGNLSTRYKFTGREYDNFTGLHYYRARFYDGKLGRFISEDPIGFAGGDVNLYGYVWNNPQQFTDPSGLKGYGGQFADWLDKKLGVAQDFYGNPMISVNPAFGMQPIRAFDIAYGFSDMFRVGEGIGCALTNNDDNIYGRAAYVAMDIKRAADLAALMLGVGEAVAGKAGSVRGANPCLLCFEADTEVQTEDGAKPIEKISTDDKVLSYNTETGEMSYQPVLEKFTRFADDIYNLQIEGERKALAVTSEHPFYAKTYRDGYSQDAEWKEVKNLKEGDLIRLADGKWAKVVEVKFKGKGQVYNFSVAENHNYFVGDSRLLTHNKCPELPGGYVKEAEILNRAEDYLGKGYTHVGRDRYVSQDGLRQFRLGKHEFLNKPYHAHFEAYDTSYWKGGVLTENTVVELIP